MKRIIKAVKTDRKLENTETGLDIVVPDFIFLQTQEIKDIFKPQKVSFHMVVTKNLSKKDNVDDKKNKDNEDVQVVHFAVDKEYTEFAKFRNDLDKKYSGTYVPKILPSDKTMTKVGFSYKAYWRACRERQLAIDKFMKWCAITPKIASSSLLDDFLGLNSLKICIEGEEQTDPTSTGCSKPESKKYEIDDLFDELDLYSDKDKDFFTNSSERKDDITEIVIPQTSKDESKLLEPEKKTKHKMVGLFATEYLTGQESKNDDKIFSLNNESKSDIPIVKPEDVNNEVVEEVDEDLGDILAQLKSVKVHKTELDLNPARKAVDKSENSEEEIPTISIDNMQGNDFLKYINENEEKENEELDLGF